MLVERDGDRDVVKLLDFGIAKMTAPADGQPGEALTQAGVVFGTPEYLSPEQAMGEEADRRADLYSAGIVLYEMLTGKRPFDAPSKVAIVSMHLTQKAMPVTQAAPEAAVPKWLERVVEHAMAKKRDERYADGGRGARRARLVGAVARHAVGAPSERAPFFARSARRASPPASASSSGAPARRACRCRAPSSAPRSRSRWRSSPSSCSCAAARGRVRRRRRSPSRSRAPRRCSRAGN